MKNNIIINKTATYYTLGDIKTAKTIWFVLHGYGYLAKYFIKKFQPILNENTAIVAPEGLSRFYKEGVDVNSRVGACWMTKENREEEIVDYVNYLNQLYLKIIEQNKNKSVKINIVGFSQGGATASRWFANGKIKCDNFILWAGMFPIDMNFKPYKNTDTFFLYGDKDQFVTPERVNNQTEVFKKYNIHFKSTLFIGGHDIPKEILLEQAKVNNWR